MIESCGNSSSLGEGSEFKSDLIGEGSLFMPHSCGIWLIVTYGFAHTIQ